MNTFNEDQLIENRGDINPLEKHLFIARLNIGKLQAQNRTLKNLLEEMDDYAQNIPDWLKIKVQNALRS